MTDNAAMQAMSSALEAARREEANRVTEEATLVAKLQVCRDAKARAISDQAQIQSALDALDAGK